MESIVDTHFDSKKEKYLGETELTLYDMIDYRIQDIVKCLNISSSFYTTKSCSGRIVIFSDTTKDGLKTEKCEWIYTCHALVDAKTIAKVLKNHRGSTTFKFEPFILYVRCRTFEDARKLHILCLGAGFKNSGITIGKSGKITLTVRSTLSLEVPLSQEGNMLVSNEYIKFIVEKANEGMTENWLQIERFFELFYLPF